MGFTISVKKKGEIQIHVWWAKIMITESLIIDYESCTIFFFKSIERSNNRT